MMQQTNTWILDQHSSERSGCARTPSMEKAKSSQRGKRSLRSVSRASEFALAGPFVQPMLALDTTTPPHRTAARPVVVVRCRRQ